FFLLPIVVLVGYLLRRRRRHLLLVAWAALLLVPPLALLGAARWASFSVSRAILRGLRAAPPSAAELPPLDRLTVTEVSRGPAGPTRDPLARGPSGEWGTTGRVAGEPQQPVRGGKLTADRLAALARHVETLRVAPRLARPPSNTDLLSIDLGWQVVTWPGLRR